MISFAAPKGWEMPTDSKPGEPFQAVGTFTADDGGKLTLTEIDGTAIGGDDESSEMNDSSDEEKDEPGETEMDSMMKRAGKMGLFDRR